MIKEHKLNIEVSKEVYENCGAEIRKKECYDNIWKVLNFGFGSKFISEGWKSAYGYVSSIEGLMARHCFIVDAEGNAIDPTLINSEFFDAENPSTYISFATLTFGEYLDKIEECDMNSSLFSAFHEEENEAKEYAMKNFGSYLCG